MGPVYKIASPQISSEAINDEVMIVNLENGVYYNLAGTGAKVWVWVQEEMTAEGILQNLVQGFRVERAEAEDSLRKFLDELQSEGLIAPHSLSEAGSLPREAAEAPENRLPFEAPILNKYTDMQELLLLDPIHDVDPSGWPRIKQD